MLSGDAPDETVQAQAAKVVGHSARGICGWVEAQQVEPGALAVALAKAVEMPAKWPRRRTALARGDRRSAGRKLVDRHTQWGARPARRLVGQ
jgi:hypothetical protein